LTISIVTTLIATMMFMTSAH